MTRNHAQAIKTFTHSKHQRIVFVPHLDWFLNNDYLNHAMIVEDDLIFPKKKMKI
jgi:hypothetical protein